MVGKGVALHRGGEGDFELRDQWSCVLVAAMAL
jgi:hypothetical protein